MKADEFRELRAKIQGAGIFLSLGGIMEVCERQIRDTGYIIGTNDSGEFAGIGGELHFPIIDTLPIPICTLVVSYCADVEGWWVERDITLTHYGRTR